MKKILVITILILLFPIQYGSKASSNTGSLAIIDTALDTSILDIKEKVIHEVCILDGPYCSNGKSFMEGPKAASLPDKIIRSNGFKHGTQMTSVAIKSNSDLNIVFIRIIGHYNNGSRRPTTSKTLPNALKWVLDNHKQYNIKAVSMSQGSHNFGKKYKNYCPFTVNNYYIQYLLARGIPVFLPAGNQSDHSRIDWPACIPEAVAVGGYEDDGTVSEYSNYDKTLIDVWEKINYNVVSPGGVEEKQKGTSISTQIAAANFIKILNRYPEYNVKDINKLIYSNMYQITNSKGMLGKVIDMDKIING
jgi:hypothetical protein